MDILMLSLIMAVVNVMDLLINIFGVIIAGMDPVKLGIMNALWTIAFIFAVRISSKLADKGRIRAQLTVALAMFICMNLFMYVFLQSKDSLILIYTYMIHAVLFSFARTGVSSYIHENYSSYEWSNILSKRTKLTIGIEAIYLVMVSLIGIQLLIEFYTIFSLFNALLFLISFLIIHEPALKIERLIHSLEGKLTDVLSRLNYFLTLSSIQTEGLIPRSFRLYGIKTIGIGLIVMGLLAFRISNEYLLTPFPFYLKKVLFMNSNDVILTYGIGRFIATLLLSILSIPLNSTTYVSSLLLRVLALSLILIGHSSVIIGFVLGLIYFTNSLIDLAIYLTYVRKTSGYNLGTYMLIGEIGSLIGTFTSGFVFNSIGLNGLSVLIIALSMLCGFIARALKQ